MEPGTRSEHPDLAWRAYPNLAAVGPLPRVARVAMEDAVRRQAVDGVGAVPWLIGHADAVRERFAALVGADPQGVALLGNTTDGVVAVANAIDWRRGDRILLFEGEFPANTTPWQVAATEHGLEIVWLPLDALGADLGLDRLEAELRRGLRLVAVSAVQFRDGLRLPVEAMTRLAHAHGAEIFVDAIQAVGAVPFAMGDADYLACGGQKWLMGPIGTGVLAVRSDRWIRLRPRLAGWLSHVDPVGFLQGVPGRLSYDRAIRHAPAMFEGGSRNLVGHVGLATSLELVAAVGVDAIAAHATAWLDRLEPQLVARGFRSLRPPEGSRSSILSLAPPDGLEAGAVAAGLAARGVSVATPDGLVRFSPGMPSPFAEIDVVLEAVDDTLAALR